MVPRNRSHEKRNIKRTLPRHEPICPRSACLSLSISDVWHVTTSNHNPRNPPCGLAVWWRGEQTWGPEAFARRIRTKIHNFGAPLPPWEDKGARPTPAARGIPKSINVILLGPTGMIPPLHASRYTSLDPFSTALPYVGTIRSNYK